jgi:hypothetical protein
MTRMVCTTAIALTFAVAGCGRSTPAASDGTAATTASAPTAGASAVSDAPAGPTDRAAAPAGASRETGPREIVLPAGTTLPVVLDTRVDSASSHVEETVRAHLRRAVTHDGALVLPAGSTVSGTVEIADPGGKVSGRAAVAVRFHSLTPRGTDEHYAIETSAVRRVAPSTKKKDALKIGAPAAGGALIGALLGGKKGALIGTAAGGGAGAAVVMTTRGEQVRLPAGTPLTIELRAPLRVRLSN